MAEVRGCYAAYVEEPEAIRPALQRAWKKVEEGMIGFVNVKTDYPARATTVRLSGARPERPPPPTGGSALGRSFVVLHGQRPRTPAPAGQRRARLNDVFIATLAEERAALAAEPHPRLDAPIEREARSGIGGRQRRAIDHYEYIGSWPILHRVGSRTVWVERVSSRDGRWHVLINAIDRECHKVGPSAVSIEDMISGTVG